MNDEITSGRTLQVEEYYSDEEDYEDLDQPQQSIFQLYDHDDYFSDDEDGPIFRQATEEIINTTGQRTKNYKVLYGWLFGSLLGEGSYAKVKEVLHTETLQRAAVKIIKKQRLRRIPNGDSNVKKELKILRNLNHPNIIHLIDFQYNPLKEKIYFFMEYCVITLQNLLDLAPDKKLPIHQTHRYFVQLLNGLEYLHQIRVIHKDIKPGNLLLNAEQTLKITDFGVAEQLDLFQDNMMCTMANGTPQFQPPEIAAGDSDFDGPAVDVWAAGVTLFNCCTGAYPFTGENVYNLYEKIEECVLILPKLTNDILAKDWENLMHGMLAKDYKERFTTAQIRKSIWFKRHRLALEEDFFEKVPAIQRELKKNSSSCYAALCRMHDVPSEEELLPESPTINIMEAINQISVTDGEVYHSEPMLGHARTASLPYRAVLATSNVEVADTTSLASRRQSKSSKSKPSRCKPS
ncbi:unnamed protein product [Oikopleura dioica]|uniref:non-specific serine/threonine protein kinase n=1 Tax=Oikopleura dioica TaxID=34765 RepID=E4XAU6_OIKDI|nr:unnamed protein product [Oikopleura dioica]